MAQESPSDSDSDWVIGDIPVRRVGLGCMRLTGHAAFGAGVDRDRSASVTVVRAAVELGVNHFDTASFYFSQSFSANDILREALRPSDDILVATKVGPSRDSAGDWMPWASPKQLRAQVEQNLTELGRDHLDLVYLRVYGRESIAEHVGVLMGLRDSGLIRHIGLSTVTLDQLDEGRALTPIVAVQQRYSLTDRPPEAETVLTSCAGAGIAFVPYFAIVGTGREAGVAGETDPAVAAVALRHGVSAAQVRLAWTLSRGPHMLAIPGTGDINHLRDNVAAGVLELTPNDLEELEA
jgi:pyridoxine 4-dehydrogenase